MYRVDVDEKTLIPLKRTTFKALNLMERYDIQEWIEGRPEILGEKLLIVAKELKLPSGTRLDLLAIDSSGALVIIELKRDDSGLEVDWQAIKYASYCSNFDQEEIVQLVVERHGIDQMEATEKLDQFIKEGIDSLNHSQRIILCANAFHSDVASAVLWLREYGLEITCVKLEPFEDEEGNLFLVPSTIIPLPEAKDYILRRELIDGHSKRKQEFSEFKFVNVGEGVRRNWDDCRKLGFVSAGGDRKFSDQLKRLTIGDKFFAYLNECGYVGYGEVVSEAVRMKDYIVESEGIHLSDIALIAPGSKEHLDDDDECEYIVGIHWLETRTREDAVPYAGLKVSRGIVTRMRRGHTVDRLRVEFGAD